MERQSCSLCYWYTSGGQDSYWWRLTTRVFFTPFKKLPEIYWAPVFWRYSMVHLRRWDTGGLCSYYYCKCCSSSYYTLVDQLGNRPMLASQFHSIKNKCLNWDQSSLAKVSPIWINWYIGVEHFPYDSMSYQHLLKLPPQKSKIHICAIDSNLPANTVTVDVRYPIQLWKVGGVKPEKWRCNLSSVP